MTILASRQISKFEIQLCKLLFILGAITFYKIVGKLLLKAKKTFKIVTAAFFAKRSFRGCCSDPAVKFLTF
jgi:hypothetical protein